MRLILVRHAEAEPAQTSDPGADSARPLTDLGRRQAAALTAALQRLGVTPDAVASSPLTRTAQTAEPLAALLPAGQGVVNVELLKPDALRPKKLTKELTALLADLGAKTVAVVGHAPDIGTYAAWLLGAEAQAVPFEKGAAACIRVGRGEVAKGCGTLEWFVTPEWCAAEPAGETTSP